MKKFKVDNLEAKRILEMHLKVRNKKDLLTEQRDEDARTKLQEMVDSKCLSNGQIVYMQTKYPYSYAYKKESKKNPGTFRYFYFNYEASEVNPTTKKLELIKDPTTGKLRYWECEQAQQTDLQSKLNDLKAREGWVEYDELDKVGGSRVAADEGRYGQPKLFDMGNGKVIKLYKFAGKQGLLSGFTPEQTEIINRYKVRMYKLSDELTQDERDTWIAEKINVPGLNNFVMYFDPNSASSDKVDATFEAESENQDMSRKTCKNKLKLYYNAFTSKKRIKPSVFTAMHNQVQACVDQHHPRWGGLRPGHFADMVKVLRGGKGGPSAYGDDKQWLIN